MKLYKLLIALLFIGLLISCNKENNFELDNFDITVENTTVNVGDSIVFTISGNASSIIFYSGLPLNDYYSDSDYIVESHYKFSFSTFVFNAAYSFDGYQPNQLRVVVSKDFKGTYDVENIKNATWVAVDDFIFAGIGPTTETLVPSGLQSINSLIEDNEDFYIAFHYLSMPVPDFGKNSTWRVRQAQIRRESSISNVDYMNHDDFSWTFIRDGIATNRGGLTSSTTLGPGINLQANAADNTVINNAWAISKKLNFSKYTNLGANFGKAIKTIVDPQLKAYGFRYTSPGVYKAVFIAKSADGGQKIIKEILINVVE